MSLSGIIRQNSLRGVVLSYVLTEPGLETVNTISEDLTTDCDGSRNTYRAVFGAVQNLEQRGFIKLGNGPNKSNKKLWPNGTIVQESGVFERHSNSDL
jgi:hypothetical protein